jgi:hypothetical protein
MQQMTDNRTALMGPFSVRLTGDAVPANEDDRSDAFPSWATSRVVKLVQRFTFRANGVDIVTNAPFFYGTADDPSEADAADVLESMLDDLASVIPYDQDDRDEAMISWLDDLGTFQGDRDAVLSGMRAWREINARLSLVRETGLSDDEIMRAVETLRES